MLVEHFKYPKLAAHEIMKTLKIGGLLFIQTHQSYPIHGVPNDYNRFSADALSALFGTEMGFRVIATDYEFPVRIFNPETTIVQTDDPARWTARKFVDCAREAIGERGGFRVALAGGTTPRKFYQLLASDEFRSKVDWSRIHFFFGDERNVARSDPESNFRTASETLFVPLSVPDGQIHRWMTECESLRLVADSYEREIRDSFGIGDGEFPRFDLILLGMGDDGHTASLFPHAAALSENRRAAVENWVEKLAAWRFTLTLPTLNFAHGVVCLVQGANKAAVLRRVVEGDGRPDEFPIQSLNPAGGLNFAVDRDAARLLQTTDRGL